MRASWRASLALVLHLSFLAVPPGLVVVLFTIAAYIGAQDRLGGAKVACAAVFVTVVLVIGGRALTRSRARPRGTPLDDAEHPKLRRLVESVARTANVPHPAKIHITSTPTVGVQERCRLLGLRRRSTTVEVGLPLLAALTDDELRALLIAQLGQSPGGGKLAGRKRAIALSSRIDQVLHRTLRGLDTGPVKWLFAGYVRTYRALAPSYDSLAFAADAAAVRLLGRRVVSTALRKQVAAELGWGEYRAEYLSMATEIGHAPDIVLGFRSFMENQERKPRLAERAKKAIAERADTGAGDGPIARDRLAAIRQAPRPADGELSERPAFTVLRAPQETVPQLEGELLAAGLDDRLPWPELARQAGAARAARQCGKLASAVELSGLQVTPSISGVLGALYHGQGRELVNPVLDPGLDPDQVDQAAEDTLTELLGAMVVDALGTAQLAHHELDWSGPLRVRLANGQPLDPDRLVRPAVTDPRLVPGLHRALVGIGVPLHHGREAVARPDPTARGVISPVTCATNTYDLLVTDRGLVLVPTRVSTLKRVLTGVAARLWRAERAKLTKLGNTEVAVLRERTGALWIDSGDIATARLSALRSGWTLAVDLYHDEYAVSELSADVVGSPDEDGLSALELRCMGEVMEHGDPRSGLRELLGARLSVHGVPQGAEQLEAADADRSTTRKVTPGAA